MGLIKRSNLFREHRYSLIAFFAVLVFFLYPNIGIYDWVKEVLYCDFIKLSILLPSDVNENKPDGSKSPPKKTTDGLCNCEHSNYPGRYPCIEY